MNVSIYSREAVEAILREGLPPNTAIISFYDPITTRTPKGYKPVDYSGVTNPVFQIAIHDIDLEILGEYNLTYETYFPEAQALAGFIYGAFDDGMNILCQCEYGQSRSAACAAAIVEHFYGKGITIFVNSVYLYDDRMTIVFNAGDEPAIVDDIMLDEIEDDCEDAKSLYSARFGSPKTPIPFWVSVFLHRGGSEKNPACQWQAGGKGVSETEVMPLRISI